MQSVHSEVDSGTFAHFGYLFFYLLACLGYYLLDTCGVYPTVGNELMKRQACYFASYGVESRKYNCLRCIVYDELYACGCFQSTYIPTFSSDNASLQLVGVDVEDGDGVFYCRLGGNTLYSLYDNTLRFFVCRHLSLLHHLGYISHSLCLSLVSDRLYELCLCLLCRQTRYLR